MWCGCEQRIHPLLSPAMFVAVILACPACALTYILVARGSWFMAQECTGEGQRSQPRCRSGPPATGHRTKRPRGQVVPPRSTPIPSQIPAPPSGPRAQGANGGQYFVQRTAAWLLDVGCWLLAAWLMLAGHRPSPPPPPPPPAAALAYWGLGVVGVGGGGWGCLVLAYLLSDELILLALAHGPGVDSRIELHPPPPAWGFGSALTLTQGY
jgi:hypothetical protein